MFAFGIGPMEWAIIGVLGVLIFGRRLPQVARGIGSSFVEFKRGLNQGEKEVTDLNKLLDNPLKNENENEDDEKKL